MTTELYYFSGTGNSLYIAKKIASAYPDSRLISIGGLDLSRPIQSRAQNIGIVFPVYFMEVPSIVKKFLNKLEVTNKPYVFTIANYGEQGGNALYNSRAILEKRHIEVAKTFPLVFPDNSIIYPTPSEKIPVLLENAELQLEAVIQSILSKEKGPHPSKNLGLQVVSNIALKLAVPFLGFKDLQINSEKCSQCGLCSKVCPVENITHTGDYPHMNQQCEMCFACLHHCPEEAIRFKKMKPQSGYQYTNPNITIKEMQS